MDVIELRTDLALTLVGAAALQRLSELALSRRWLRRTAAETGAAVVPEPIFPLMVLLHAGWLAGCALEPLLWPRPVLPALSVAMAVVLAGALLLRVWTLHTLGRYWHVRIVQRTAQPVVTGGPYRYVRHPNYAVVVLEVAALPLLLGAYGTALLASAVNALVLAARIRREEAYLRTLPAWRAAFARKKRFVPGLF